MVPRKKALLDVSARFGNPCYEFFPEFEAYTCRKFGEIDECVADASVVCFGGGEDISPSLYGHKADFRGAGERPSSRDLFEVDVFKSSVRQNKPIVGICRGAQLVCALSGGALVQDVDGHGRNHPIYTNDGQVFEITSTHHQMMYLLGLDPLEYSLDAWDIKRKGEYRRDYKKAPKEQDVDPEVVWFRKTKAFAIQGHPEYMAEDAKAVVWLKERMYYYFPQLKG